MRFASASTSFSEQAAGKSPGSDRRATIRWPSRVVGGELVGHARAQGAQRGQTLAAEELVLGPLALEQSRADAESTAGQPA